MDYLLDTNILVRMANTADSMYATAVRAVLELHQRGETLNVTAQNLVEFRSVATRPKIANGLGLPAVDAEVKSNEFEISFGLLEETPSIFATWKSIVLAANVIGKQVHDARLVAVCHVHSVTHLLTFNVAHFARFTNYGPGLNVVDPSTI